MRIDTDIAPQRPTSVIKGGSWESRAIWLASERARKGEQGVIEEASSHQEDHELASQRGQQQHRQQTSDGMIEITSFLLKHLYELMADDYNAAGRQSGPSQSRRSGRPLSSCAEPSPDPGQVQMQGTRQSSADQETNQQIVLFLAQNHLPDLICETFIELLFICVFLAVSWIFVMIVQLHCNQVHQPARHFYCNTKFLSSLMYCNNKIQALAS